MLRDIQLSPRGLWTAPANVDAPPGALRKAEEVVIRNKGKVGPRPGFSSQDLFTGTTRRLIDFKTDYMSVDPSTPTTRWASLDSEVHTVAGSDLTWHAYAIQGVEVRGNLYLTTKDGLRKIDSVGGTTARPAGCPTVNVMAITESSGSTIEDGNHTVYRALIKRTDANGYVVRGAVSNPALYGNDSGTGPKAPTILISLHKTGGDSGVADFVAGDVVEIYRTIQGPIGETPVDDEFFVQSVTLTAGFISAGYFTIQDRVEDTSLGRALYTNEAEEGLEGDNTTPPAAKTLALFNGSLFLADLTFHPAKTFSFNLSGDLDTDSSGIGYLIDSSCGVTNGSAVVTSVSSTANLKVGMIALAAGTGKFTGATSWVRIASIDSATQVTLTSNWTGSNGTGSFLFVDSIKIGSQYFPIGLGTVECANWIRGVESYTYSSSNFSGVVVAASTLVSADALNLEAGPGYRELYLQGLDYTTTVGVNATHGDKYDPALAEPSGTAYNLPQETMPNGIMWSDNQQPEKFKLANVERLGHIDRIQRLVGTKNALFAFKETGLYRVAGEGEASGFRFDPHDPGVRLLYPEAAATVGDKVYAWCDFGVFEVDENGCTNISQPAIANRLEPLEKKIKAGSVTAHGAWAIANIKDHEFILGVPSTSDLTDADSLYVFNQQEGAWTQWFVSRNLECGLYHASTAQVFIQEGALTWAERSIVDDQYYTRDRAYDITISSVGTDGKMITIAAASGWTPAVGDLVKKSSTWTRVVTITDATHFTVDTVLTTGSANAYVAFTSVVEFIANTAKDPGRLKLWGEGAIWFEDLEGLTGYGLAFTSSVSATAVNQTKTLSTLPMTGHKAEAFRFETPRNHARSTRLYVDLTVRQAGATWELSSITAYYRFMGARVRNT